MVSLFFHDFRAPGALAHGVDASQVAVEMWLESEGHRDNIEGPYTLSGIGSYERDGAIYFTQIFLGID